MNSGAHSVGVRDVADHTEAVDPCVGSLDLRIEIEGADGGTLCAERTRDSGSDAVLRAGHQRHPPLHWRR